MTMKNSPKHFPGVHIRTDFKPGDAGRLIELHGLLYSKEYGFNHTFEAYVAKPLAEFMLRNSTRERIWFVDEDGELVGSIAIIEHSASVAQLRWYLLHPRLRGKGLGKRLMDDAIAFCRAAGYKKVFLWTVSSLLTAARVYEKSGFHISEEKTHEIWGKVLTEQRYDLDL